VWLYGVLARSAPRQDGSTVLTSQSIIAALDPVTGKLVQKLALSAGPYEIAYGDNSLFAANFSTGQVLMIDRRFRLHQLQRVHGPGTLVAATSGAVWATTADGVLRRIKVAPR
jgi:hypothetical protein